MNDMRSKVSLRNPKIASRDVLAAAAAKAAVIETRTSTVADGSARSERHVHGSKTEIQYQHAFQMLARSACDQC